MSKTYEPELYKLEEELGKHEDELEYELHDETTMEAEVPTAEDEWKLETSVAGPEEEADYQIIGRDDRVPVRNTTKVPFRYICKLEIYWAGSRRPGGCTGTLIAPNKVLTAAHCLFSRRGSGFPRRIRVIPGKNGQGRTRRQEPFGFALSRRIDVSREWRIARTTTSARAFDYGVITLDRPIGRRVGWWRHIASKSKAFLLHNRIYTFGYPGDKGGRQQWGMRERIVGVSPRLLEYAHDTMPGQSGSPVWAKQGQIRTIVGIHTRADDPKTPVVANVGVRITPKVLANIQRWVRT